MKRSDREAILRDPESKGYFNTGRTKRVMRALKGKVVEYNYSIFKDRSTGKEIRIRTSDSAIRRSRGERVTKKNLDNIISDIARSSRLDNVTATALKNKIEAKLKEKTDMGEKLYMSSVNTITHNYMENLAITSIEEQEELRSKKKIASAIFNTGELPEDLAKRLSAQSGVRITEDDLLNPDNWHGDNFTFGSVRWRFHFTYTGDVLTRVGA